MRAKRSRRQGGALTIRDVAAHAGDHRDELCPEPAARSLARADPIRIGLLYSNASAAYLSEFLVGGLEEVSRSNMQLAVRSARRALMTPTPPHA